MNAVRLIDEIQQLQLQMKRIDQFMQNIDTAKTPSSREQSNENDSSINSLGKQLDLFKTEIQNELSEILLALSQRSDVDSIANARTGIAGVNDATSNQNDLYLLIDSMQRQNLVIYEAFANGRDSSFRLPSSGAEDNSLLLTLMEDLRNEITNMQVNNSASNTTKRLDSLEIAMNIIQANKNQTNSNLLPASEKDISVSQDNVDDLIDRETEDQVNPNAPGNSNEIGTGSDGASQEKETILLLNAIIARLDRLESDKNIVASTPELPEVNVETNVPADTVNTTTTMVTADAVKADTLPHTDTTIQAANQPEWAAKILELETKLNQMTADYIALTEKVAEAETKKELVEVEPEVIVAQVVVPVEEVKPTAKVFFKSNQTLVEAAYYAKLERIANYLYSNPESNLEIRGYADPSGNAEYNRQLALQRADNVRKIFVLQHDIDPLKIRVISMGEEILDGNLPDYSRRVEVQIN